VKALGRKTGDQIEQLSVLSGSWASLRTPAGLFLSSGRFMHVVLNHQQARRPVPTNQRRLPRACLHLPQIPTPQKGSMSTVPHAARALEAIGLPVASVSSF
jgi:hypothetical protein